MKRSHGLVLAPTNYLDFEPLGTRRDAIRSEFLLAPRKGVGVLGVDAELFQIIVPMVDLATGVST